MRVFLADVCLRVSLAVGSEAVMASCVIAATAGGNSTRRASELPTDRTRCWMRAWVAPAVARLAHGEQTPVKAAPILATASIRVKLSTVGTSFQALALAHGHDASLRKAPREGNIFLTRDFSF